MGWCERTLSIGFIWNIGQWSRVDTGFDLMQCGLQLGARVGDRIMGCFSSQDNWENCSRPWMHKNPSSATKGLNLTRGELLGILRPFLNASSSAEKAFSCSARIKHCLATWSSSNDKTPFRLSVGEDFKFWIKRCTQATTRMAFVKVLHRSSGNTGGTGSHDTNAASTASSDWEEWSPGDSTWSSITQGPSTRNPGPCNHMSEFTSSSAENPWSPDLLGCPSLDNETIFPSKSTFGFHWCDWKWKFSNEKGHSQSKTGQSLNLSNRCTQHHQEVSGPLWQTSPNGHLTDTPATLDEAMLFASEVPP